LQLSGAPRRHQYVTIVAVEAFDQFHGLSPLVPGLRISIAESLCAVFSASEAKNYAPIFPRISMLWGPPAFNIVTED
jgi:hypothetical protein